MNWMKYRLLYFALSLMVIAPGVYSLLRFGLPLSIDFTGGSTLQLVASNADPNQLTASINTLQPVKHSQTNPEGSITLQLAPLAQTQLTDLETKLRPDFPELTTVAFFSVGPTVGREMISKTLAGIALAAGLILLFVARAFNSLKFGLCAILAMLHDTLVLVGSFSLLGHFFNAPVDLLFVTATLTILSFSVHDTIVVYDRIREIKRRQHHLPLYQVADIAISQTLSRSINNSLTIIFMLLSLAILGGQPTGWVAVALLIGTITGTFSSTFTATPLLVTLDNLLTKKNSHR